MSEQTSPSRLPHLLPRMVVLALLAGIAVSLLQPKVRLGELTGETMGTTWTVKVVTRGFRFGPRDEEKLKAAVDACLAEVDHRMSTYKPESELSRFNRHAEGTPFQLSDELFHVLQRSMQISDLTGGAFDITVGPIVNAYGFGPESRPVEPPSDATLAEMKQRVGYHLVAIDPATRTARKQRPDVYCDLSAIAKGFAVDRVAKLIESKGILDYMVEVGGEVRVGGLNHESRPWRIAIEKPADEGRAVHRVLGLTDKAVATSGDYRNYYMSNGARISHEIDPRTGRTVRNDLASATVIHDDCETADALATALMVLGPDESYNFAVNHGLAVLLLVRRPGDELVERTTPAFDALVAAGRVVRSAGHPADAR